MRNQLDKHLPDLLVLPSKPIETKPIETKRKYPKLAPKKGNKVLIVTQFYPPDYAATGQLIAELFCTTEQVRHENQYFYRAAGICVRIKRLLPSEKFLRE